MRNNENKCPHCGQKRERQLEMVHMICRHNHPSFMELKVYSDGTYELIIKEQQVPLKITKIFYEDFKQKGS